MGRGVKTADDLPPRAMDSEEFLREGDVWNGYLSLLQEVRMLKEDILEDKCRLEGVINTSNMLFKKIKTSSELKLDAKITALSTRLACTRMEKDIDSSDVTSKRLLELFEKDLLDGFYRYAAECDRRMRFLECFSLGNRAGCEERRRRQYQRSRLVYPEAAIPKAVVSDEDLVEEPEVLSQIDRIVAKNGRIEYFRLVTNPESFSKTIENIFYLSLALRSEVVSLEFGEELYVCTFRPSEESSLEHLVIEITYDEYLRMVERIGISEALIKTPSVSRDPID